MTEASHPIVLRPIVPTSAVFVFVAVFCLAVGTLATGGPLALALSDPTGDRSDVSYLIGLSLTIPTYIVGLFLVIRGPSMKVTLTDDEAIVRNLFKTQVIPRKLVIGIGTRTFISGYGTSQLSTGIEWRGPKGTTRGRAHTLTVVSFLSTAAYGSLFMSGINARIAVLKEWCEAKPAPRAAHPADDIAQHES
jgi:hypothetical protein